MFFIPRQRHGLVGLSPQAQQVAIPQGREYAINEAVKRSQVEESVDLSDEIPATVGSIDLFAACRAAGIENVQILTTMPHSSLKKAASVN